MKKLMVLIALLGGFSLVNAQEQGKFRVGLDVGYAFPKGGGGVSFAIEPKYNIGSNMNVGIRWETALMGRALQIADSGVEIESSVSGSTAFYGTFDYYFGGDSSFAPFVGAGIGYSSLAGLEVTVGSVTEESDSEGKFAGLVRAGFEWGKFRLALNYNLIGKTEYDNGNSVKNSYLGLNLGFYLGGGKWGK